MYSRKHHCRNCGGLFCGPCSRRRSPIPSLGYDSPVRVCEVCFQLVDAMVPKRSAAASGQFTTAPPSPPRSTVSSIAEDDTASDEAAVGKARSGSQRANPPPPPVTDAIRRATVSGMPRSSQPGPVHAKTLTAAQARQAQAQKRHSVMPKPPPPPPRRPGGKRRNQSTFVRRAKPQRPSVPPPEHLLAQRKLPKPEPKPEEGTKET